MMVTASHTNSESVTLVPRRPEVRAKQSDTKYTCPGCHSTFEKWTGCLHHMRDCRPDLADDCSRVDCVTLYKSSMGEHLRSITNESAPKPPLSNKAEMDSTEESILRAGTVIIKLKYGAKCPFSPTKKQKSCDCVVDEQKLYHMRCVRCARVIDVSADPEVVAKKYLLCRRLAGKSRGLLSVSVCLDGPSFKSLTADSQRCGIFSNTSVPHVTFVEGLESWSPESVDDYTEGLRSLQLALCLQPTMTIVNLRSVPQKNSPHSLLIVADLSVPYAVNKAADRLRTHPECRLPQFQYHIAVGACKKNSLEYVLWAASQVLIGSVLSVGFNPPVVFPPTSCDGEQRMNGVPSWILETSKRTSVELNRRLMAEEPWMGTDRSPLSSQIHNNYHVDPDIKRQRTTDLCYFYT